MDRIFPILRYSPFVWVFNDVVIMKDKKPIKTIFKIIMSFTVSELVFLSKFKKAMIIIWEIK